jgi:hypothetical protein
MCETGSGAVSRNNVGRSNILVQVQEFNCEQLRVSGCKFHDKVYERDGAVCKNRDKQLTFIVRVIASVLLFVMVQKTVSFSN